MSKIIPWRYRSRFRRSRLGVELSQLAFFTAVILVAAVIYRLHEPRSVERNTLGSFGLCRSEADRNCVIDGDTIRHAGEKIRLLDIDAPEIASPQCPREASLGERAKHRLLALINAGTFEIVAQGLRDTDQYGRKLRLLKRNGKSLGDVLVDEGLARHFGAGRQSWCH